jgi:chromosome segregation ATPase
MASKGEEITRIAQERDNARQELTTLTDSHQAKSDEARRLSEEASAASSRAEAATAEANQSLTRIAALEADLEEARHALATERQSHAAGADETSLHRNELERITRELDEVRQQVSTLSEAKAAANAELVRLTQDASAARDRARDAEERAAELAQRIAKLNEARAESAQGGQQAEIPVAESDPAADVAILQRQISAQAKAHAKAFNDLRANAEQWVAHAKELKQRLGQASEKVLFIDARSTGEVALVRRLSSELERLKPDHELVSRDVQQKLISSTMAQQLAMKGYRYDPTTAVMSKVDG